MTEHSGRLCQITGTMPGAFELKGNEPEALTVPLSLGDGYEFVFMPLRFRFNQRGYWMFAVLPSVDQQTVSMFEDLHRAIGILGTHNLQVDGDETDGVNIRFVSK